jgi:phytoene desaturase
MSAREKKVIVIGAGIAGMAAAIRMACKGYTVDIYEARSEPGGKLHGFQLGDFRFDAGPSLFTMPEHVTDLFRIAGKNPEDYFRYRQLEDACTYFWPDGSRLTARSDPKAFAHQAAETFHVPVDRVLDYLEHAQKLFTTSGAIFLEKPLASPTTWMDLGVIKALWTLRSSDLMFSMDRVNRLRLEEPHLVQLFNRFATYNGSDPYRTPGIMAMIAALEHGQGVYFPKGGMVSITHALHRLLVDLGVRMHFNQMVDEILVEGGKATGVRVGPDKIPADWVISNMDIWYSYRRLLPGQKAPERVLHQERSSSAMVFYWGMKSEFPELGLHNIFFSGDYPGEFRDIFKEGRLSGDPTVYVNISSKEQDGDAPAGCENWFVMVNAPRHQGQDWETQRRDTRIAIINKLKKQLGRDISSAIIEERIWDPPGIEADTWSYQGALYGNSSNNAFAAFLRHPNKNGRIQNLLHVGGTVHPGGGIPLCLLSAKIATAEL